MTIIELIKQNFLISTVPGGITISFSYAFLFISLVIAIAYKRIKTLFKKKNN